MKIKALFITAIMGVAVVSGICKGLSSPRNGAKKDDEEKTGEKEVRSGEKVEV